MFGTNDKPALVTVILVVTIALGALAGRLRPPVARALIAAAAAIGAWSAYVERDASWVHALPPVVGGTAAALTLHLLWRAMHDRTVSPLTPAGADRRRRECAEAW